MKEKKEYNLEEESYDMEIGNAYDLAIKKTLLDRYPNLEKKLEVTDGVYFNDEYHNALWTLISEKKENEKKYKSEFESSSPYPNEEHVEQRRWKMCSIASSSRLCFLKYKEEAEFEKIIKNDRCRPHFDAYKEKDNTFFECKCHEIVQSHTPRLSRNAYEGLLNEWFGITLTKNNIRETKDGEKIALSFEMFGINDIELPCGKYFDFKQFICHVLGLLGDEVKKRQKPTLQYVFFLPNKKYLDSERLKKWNLEFKELIKNLFPLLREIKVKDGKLKDYINLADPLKPLVSEVNDPILEKK